MRELVFSKPIHTANGLWYVHRLFRWDGKNSEIWPYSAMLRSDKAPFVGKELVQVYRPNGRIWSDLPTGGDLVGFDPNDLSEKAHA